MRHEFRAIGALAASLVAPHLAFAQSAIVIPPPGTPVAPIDIPAHVVPAQLDRGDKPAGRKLINSANAQIDYRIDSFGPSGIGRVDIYITPDRGATWVKSGEDADKESPASVRLPGEGLYGIRLAIANGNGFGGRAPRPGDRPQRYVEVDATPPSVSLQSCTMAPNMAAIDIRWTAVDANMAAEPVSIFYRCHPDAGWQPINQAIKNDGFFRWSFPHDIAPQIFLKLEVADLAGNVTKVENPSPLRLDLTELEATIVDAAPINRGSPNNITPVSIPTAQPSGAAVLSPPVQSEIPPAMPATLPALPPFPPLPQ